MPRAAPPCDELLIRLTSGSDGEYRTVVFAPGGLAAQGSFRKPFSEAELESFQRQVDSGRGGGSGTQRTLARQFGETLFDALISDGPVRDAYAAAKGRADANRRALRMTLSLSGAPDLMAVPWEFLFDAPSFLAQSVWTPVVRFLDLSSAPRPLPVRLPLRILGLVSAPSGLPALEVERERANLERALSGLVDAGVVQIKWLPARMPALHRELARGDDVHVFHFIGHGIYNNGEGYLAFEDPKGSGPDLVTGQKLGQMLSDRRSVRLAVLNACEAAITPVNDPFAGVASALVANGVPAVVAMQFSITDEVAVTFAEEFFAALAESDPVDAAVTEACRAIAATDDVQWASPVLFMRIADGRVFRLSRASARARLAPVPGGGEAEGGLEPHEPAPGGGGEGRVAGARTILDGELEEAITDAERILALGYWPGGERRHWWQTWLEFREGLVTELGGGFTAVRDAFEAVRRLQDGLGAEHREFIETDRPFLESARETMAAGRAALGAGAS
jgi:CHAT domain